MRISVFVVFTYTHDSTRVHTNVTLFRETQDYCPRKTPQRANIYNLDNRGV